MWQDQGNMEANGSFEEEEVEKFRKPLIFLKKEKSSSSSAFF